MVQHLYRTTRQNWCLVSFGQAISEIHKITFEMSVFGQSIRVDKSETGEKVILP